MQRKAVVEDTVNGTNQVLVTQKERQGTEAANQILNFVDVVLDVCPEAVHAANVGGTDHERI